LKSPGSWLVLMAAGLLITTQFACQSTTPPEAPKAAVYYSKLKNFTCPIPSMPDTPEIRDAIDGDSAFVEL
jgi:hypothetical protein